MSTSFQVHTSKDKEQLAQDFARYFADWANQQTKLASVALSGGSTPKRFFEILATDYRDKIDWSSLLFFWGDDRCVPPDHEESNYKMANDLFLKQVGVPVSNIFRVRGEDDPAAEAIRYSEIIEQTLPTENGLPVFDFMLQGMGDDGHTASIFPDQMELLTNPATCAVATHPVSGQKRVTLTGPVINNAKLIVFLVAGENKAAKVASVLQKDAESEAYPATHIQANNGELLWYLDQGAAQLA
ncbi:MAG: 6-phosphogluconolactonase [Bacteroidota bacterium]